MVSVTADYGHIIYSSDLEDHERYFKRSPRLGHPPNLAFAGQDALHLIVTGEPVPDFLREAFADLVHLEI